MYLPTSKVLAIAGAVLTLTSPTAGYIVTIWQNPDCTGTSRDINVYDGTCRDVSPGFAAITPRVYNSAHAYRAFMFGAAHCLGTQINDWWADGGSDKFKIGACLSLNGAIGNSMANFIAAG